MKPEYDSHKDASDQNHLTTVGTLLQYLWQADRPDLKIRVVTAMLLLVAAEVATVFAPFILKYVVDDLSTPDNTLIVVPVALIIAFGMARVVTQTFGELRDAVFAKVGQNAIRKVSLKTFQHLHNLSLRFHLDRQTGGLSRVIERGTKGIEFLLRFTLFNIGPTLLKIIFICSIMWIEYGPAISLITFTTLAGYIFFTLAVTEWRLKYRREMNKQDSEANTKAIDSLLNFETVKYFGNEAHEAARFDKSIARYEKAAVKSLTTLAYLNIGQGFIISLGMVTVLLLAGFGVADGRYTVGDFVAIQAFLMLLIQPLNFLGFVYREIKQSLVDMEKMFELLQVSREVPDKASAEPLGEGGGEVEFHNVNFGYEDNRQILKNVSFKVSAGKSAEK